MAEVARIKELGLNGVNTNADPQNDGLPDLGEPHWDPMWEACADLGLPVNFHIGASVHAVRPTTARRRGRPWPTRRSWPSARP